MIQMVVKAILRHHVLQIISHLIFIFMNINNIFRILGKNAESKRQYIHKNVYIMVNDCLDIVL